MPWLLGLALLQAATSPAFAESIAILEFELQDLTLNPDLAGETARAASLRPLLVRELDERYRLTVADNPASAAIEAGKGAGYLFDRPELAARIGREAGAGWVLAGRLHKASFLFVYLQAQLIDTRSGRIAADFVVEIKGPQQKLTIKGVESLARQIDAALAKLDGARSEGKSAP